MEVQQHNKEVWTPGTLVELAGRRADAAAEQTAYRFPYAESGEDQLSYAQVDSEARRIAAYLQHRQLTSAPIVLLLPTGSGFVKAFFACQYANLPAVPVSAPRNLTQVQGLQRILDKCASRTVITERGFLAKLKRRIDLEACLPNVTWVVLEDIPAEPQAWQAAAVTPESPALLQFTSGSTGNPKGVVVTHRNIIENQLLIEQGFRHTHDAVVVGWLPLFHDMGLIGNMLNPFYMQRPCILMSPEQFLRNPRIWLETISTFKATTSGGPNFAYEMCVQRSGDELGDLDLSNWRIAYVGAEPVRPGTMRRFAKKFAPAGFDPSAFYPCYGLAEGTLIVTGVDRGVVSQQSAYRQLSVVQQDAPPQSQETLPCGGALGGQQVIVVDPEAGTRCADGSQGEIWIAGACVAAGYYCDPEVTEQVFQAYLNSGEGPFLRTGDIGVWIKGQLVLRGRLKDMIIVSGENLFAEDIEGWLTGCDADLLAGSITAFPLQLEGGECLAVVAEVRRERRREVDAQAVADNIRAILAKHIEVPVSLVVLCQTGTIPRTTSGKVQHWQCSELFARPDVEVLYRSELNSGQGSEAPETDAGLPKQPSEAQVSAWLRARIAGKTGQAESGLSITASFAQLGISSADALEITVLLGQVLRLSLDDTLFWEYPSIEEASRYVSGLVVSNGD